MKLKVFEESEKDDHLYLKLVQLPMGRVGLYACEKDGSLRRNGLLITIDSDRIFRARAVDPNFGFDLDSHGRIETV